MDEFVTGQYIPDRQQSNTGYATLGEIPEQENLQHLHKRLQEQLNFITDMESQVRNLASNTFGPQPINESKTLQGDAIEPTLATLVYAIERATSRLRSQINRF